MTPATNVEAHARRFGLKFLVWNAGQDNITQHEASVKPSWRVQDSGLRTSERASYITACTPRDQVHFGYRRPVNITNMKKPSQV